jgi:AraC-like DNA-binding protein
MTAGANSLTDHVTRPPGGAGSGPTLGANDLRVMLGCLTRLGYPVTGLLAAAGFPGLDMDDPDARFSCDAFGKVVACAQRERFTPNLGLELACLTPLGAYPLLDYLVLTSETVGAGIQQLACYYRLVGNPLTIHLHETEDPIRVEYAGSGSPLAVEYSAVLMIRHLRDETDGRFAVSSVSFRHMPDDTAAFERLLGCRISTSDSWNGVSVPLEAWRLSLRRRDPVLRGLLKKQADDVLARMPSRSGAALEVQRALMPRLAGGDARIDTVARELAISVRTLQRRLAEAGVSFQELLDESRKEAAARYLGEPTLSIGEVSYLAGYSEPAPFYRAFRRWYGTTPEVFRYKLRHPL